MNSVVVPRRLNEPAGLLSIVRSPKTKTNNNGNKMKKIIVMTVLAAFACGVMAAPLSIDKEADKAKTCEKCKDCKEGCKCHCHAKKADDKK